jgi:outer membrane biosynthesis protein TonB
VRSSRLRRPLRDGIFGFGFARSLAALLLASALGAVESSCHKRQVAIPLPSIPAQQPAVTEPPPSSPPPEATQSAQPAPPAPTPPVPPATAAQPMPTAPAPPASSPPRRPPARPATPQSPTPPAPAASPDPPASPAPRLGDVLSADQQRQLNGAIDQSLTRAQGSLNAVGNRQLSKDQQAVVEQVRNFIQQAQKLRTSNLPAAKSLAERAEVLARDLAASLR